MEKIKRAIDKKQVPIILTAQHMRMKLLSQMIA